jgi:hypothetical protein
VVTSSAAFWRTNELGESAQVAEHLTGVWKDNPDQIVVSGSFFQETTKAKRFGLLRKAAQIAVPALAATGLLVAGAAAWPLAALGGIAALVTGIVATAEGPALKASLEDYRLSQEYQEFEGLNVWREGPSGQVDVERTSSPEAGLREMLVSNMRDYPGSLHVVHANGHGMGSRYSAGLPTRALAGALNQATEKAGNEVDVAILDTCFGSNFESLALLAHTSYPGVNFVVAFEDAIPNGNSDGGRLPLQEMLQQAVKESSGREMALAMAQTAGEFFDRPNNHEIAEIPLPERLSRETLPLRRKGLDSTVAAVDMQALKTRLHPALDEVGALLQRALDDPSVADVISEAKKASEIESSRDLIDLGGFLGRITENTPEGSPLYQGLKSALSALDATLLFKRTGEKFPLSGLSVHTREGARRSSEISPRSTNPLEGDHLPQGWADFIKAAF